MAVSNKPRIPFIIGPTASGKTALSVELASRLSAEIISADSRQIYQRMDIGTAKPEPAILANIPHHFIDRIDPTTLYSAGEWGRDALPVIERLLAEGKRIIIVGGSGFYIKALVDGFFDQPDLDKNEMLRVREQYQTMRLSTLRHRLKQIDPLSAERIQPNDRQRTIRALEIHEMTGQKLSDLQKMSADIDLPFEPVYFGIDFPREQLYERISQRTDQMILDGLIEEVEMLISDGYDHELNAFQTVGYREIFPYLQGRVGLYDTVNLIKQNTRRYAKRQLTWFRNMENVNWLDGLRPAAKLADDVVKRIKIS